MVKTAGGYATPTVLASFDGTDALNPFGSLIADADGNLFGTTREGGSFGLGTVFEIVKTAAGYAGTPVILLSFDGVNGATPFAGLIADGNGNLFGTTWEGGYIGGQCASCGYGTVFEIAKTAGGYASTQTVLVRFDWTHGGNSRAGLIADANGNLFGTAEAGGSYYGGTIFEIVKTAGGYASTPTVLYNFDDHTGVGPVGALIADANGNLFGTTRFRGPNGAGTVFELSGTGFVPPLRFAGVPGTANCIGVSTSTLTRTYGGISAGAKALGFAGVAALQSAIAAFCGN